MDTDTVNDIKSLVSSLDTWHKNFRDDIEIFVKTKAQKDWSPHLNSFIDIVSQYSLEYLIEHGSSIGYIECYICWSMHKALPMHKFLRYGNKVGVMLCFLFGFFIDNLTWTDFSNAIIQNLDIGYLFLAAGFDISERKLSLTNILYERISHCSLRFVKFMIDEAGVDPNCIRPLKYSLLHQALFNTDYIVILLLNRGANVNLKVNNMTPLCYGLFHECNIKSLRAIVIHGARLELPEDRRLSEKQEKLLKEIGYEIA